MEKFHSFVDDESTEASSNKSEKTRKLKILQQPPNWRGELFKKYGKKIFFFIRDQIDWNKLECVAIEAPKEFVQARNRSKEVTMEIYAIKNSQHLGAMARKVL